MASRGDVLLTESGVRVKGDLETSGDIRTEGKVEVQGGGGIIAEQSNVYVNSVNTNGISATDIRAAGLIDGHGEVRARGALLLYANGTVPFGWYALSTLAQQMADCGIAEDAIGYFVPLISGAPMVLSAVEQATLTLAHDKVTATSFHLGGINPTGQPNMPVFNVCPLDPKPVDLLVFDAANSAVHTPNLKVDGSVSVGPEHMDLVAEIKALQNRVERLEEQIAQR